MVTKVVPGHGPPPLLSKKETCHQLRQSGLFLSSAEVYNRRLSVAAELCSDRSRGIRLVKNDSSNCFATSLLLTMMAVSKVSGDTWPKAETVTPRARPFFRLVEVLNSLNDDDEYSTESTGLEVCAYMHGLRVFEV